MLAPGVRLNMHYYSKVYTQLRQSLTSPQSGAAKAPEATSLFDSFDTGDSVYHRCAVVYLGSVLILVVYAWSATQLLEENNRLGIIVACCLLVLDITIGMYTYMAWTRALDSRHMVTGQTFTPMRVVLLLVTESH